MNRIATIFTWTPWGNNWGMSVNENVKERDFSGFSCTNLNVINSYTFWFSWSTVIFICKQDEIWKSGNMNPFPSNFIIIAKYHFILTCTDKFRLFLCSTSLINTYIVENGKERQWDRKLPLQIKGVKSENCIDHKI